MFKKLSKRKTYLQITRVWVHRRQNFIWDLSHSIEQFVNGIIKFENCPFFSHSFYDSALLSHNLISSVGCMLGILNLKNTLINLIYFTYLDGIKLTTHTTICSIIGTHQYWLFLPSMSFNKISSGVLFILNIWFTWTLNHAKNWFGTWYSTVSSSSWTWSSSAADGATWTMNSTLVDSWSWPIWSISWLVTFVIGMIVRRSGSTELMSLLSAHCFLYSSITFHGILRFSSFSFNSLNWNLKNVLSIIIL